MKYKVIKSAAHNFGHSFVSAMNYRADDYVMSHLVRSALATGAAELRVDLHAGTAEPAELLPAPVRDSVDGYVGWLPALLASHRVASEAIVAGRMAVRLDLGRASDDVGFRDHVEVPFECVVALTDDRGRVHEGRTRGWWSAHRGGPAPLVRDFRAPPANPRPERPSAVPRPWWKFWALSGRGHR